MDKDQTVDRTTGEAKNASAFVRVGGLLLISLLLILFPLPSIGGTGNLMLILDSSGSMWGQLEGRTKIEIAREVMSGLVFDLPDELNVGLVAYGHRRKGDCSDVEQIVALGPLNKHALAAQIQRLKPKGKTPLSRSVRETADSLRHLEDETTILLVSDGKETCGDDPCALVRDLRNSGIKFVLHVVGFDVTDDERQQLQCMAEMGGGTYYAAANAGDLKHAVQEIQRSGQLKVVALRNGTPIVAQVRVTSEIDRMEAGTTTLNQGRPLTFKLVTGSYRVTVKDPEIPGLEPVIFDAVTVAGGATVTRVAAFTPAQLRVAATKHGRPAAASYRIVPAGESDPVVSVEGAQAQAFWLPPGAYDIEISESGSENPETVRFGGVAVAGGERVERVADFSGGRLLISATRSGQPIRARVDILEPEDESDLGTFHTSANRQVPTEIELKPGVYTAVVIDESSEKKSEVVFSGIEITKGSVVDRNADFSDGSLQIIALRNGELIKAAVEVATAGSSPKPVAKDTTSADVESPLKLLLPLGSYTIHVIDTGNPAKPSVELGDVEVRAGPANEQVAEFEAAILDLRAVKNKKPVAALATIVSVPSNKKKTTVVSATEKPKRLFLAPGTYDILVKQGNEGEQRTAEFSGVEIDLGDTIEKIADFSDGYLIIEATRNSKPFDAYGYYYRKGKEVAQSVVTKAVLLPPGAYDVKVPHSTVPGRPATWIKGVTVKSGEETVFEGPEFFDGTARGSAKRNGKPYDAYSYYYREGEHVTNNHVQELVTLLPGTYDVRIVHGAVPGNPEAWIKGVIVKAGEETVFEGPEFFDGTARGSATRNGKPYDAYSYYFRDGEHVTNNHVQEQVTLLPGIYDVKIVHGTVPGNPVAWVKGVTIRAGEETVFKGPEFFDGTVQVNAALNGKPFDAYGYFYREGEEIDQATSPDVVTLLPGTYNIKLRYPEKEVWVKGVAVNADKHTIVNVTEGGAAE